jgi:hypothetical protein
MLNINRYFRVCKTFPIHFPIYLFHYEYNFSKKYKTKTVNNLVNISLLPFDIIKGILSFPFILLFNIFGISMTFARIFPRFSYKLTQHLLKELDDYLSTSINPSNVPFFPQKTNKLVFIG